MTKHPDPRQRPGYCMYCGSPDVSQGDSEVTINDTGNVLIPNSFVKRKCTTIRYTCNSCGKEFGDLMMGKIVSSEEYKLTEITCKQCETVQQQREDSASAIMGLCEACYIHNCCYIHY